MRRMRNPARGAEAAVLLLVAVGLHAQNADAQSPKTGSANSKLFHAPAQVPSILHPQYVAMGDRLQKPGNERITLTGTLLDSTGTSDVQIVVELGGKLSIVWQGGPKKILFSGTNSSISGSIAISSDLLEAFVDDLAETVLNAVATGTGLRLLGQKFPDVSGAYCDYFDVPTFGVAEKKATAINKRYCFDSKTSFLRSVRYLSGGSASETTVTEFGNWATVNGEAVPGIVTRFAGGNQVFQFRSTKAKVSPGVADTTFTP